MRIASLDTIAVNVPYRHREVSSQVARDGVTDVLVRLETDDGVVGWGEACSGADTESIVAALSAMRPFVVGRALWEREAIRAEIYHRGLWNFRAGTAGFAFTGIDMALLDAWARSLGQPLHRLFGGAVRDSVSYFYYLARGDRDDLQEQCRRGREAGFCVFYLKVGLDDADDVAMARWVREAIGDEARLRLDANGAWTFAQARRLMGTLVPFDVEFVEQPIRESPVRNLRDLRAFTGIPVCANEGLWSEADAYERITARQADVYCFSPYWVGGLDCFHRLAHVARMEGLSVCKHTHGELGIAAAAIHHVLLTLPNLVEGNQQTATVMQTDVLEEPLPIRDAPEWGVLEEPGIGVGVSEDALEEAAERYRSEGQYLPYAR